MQHCGCNVAARHAAGLLDCMLASPPCPTTAPYTALPLRQTVTNPTNSLFIPVRTVVVCAPTGAGKTAIAEAATLHILAKGQRVIYTTPLKALSNQKLGEMRERFG